MKKIILLILSVFITPMFLSAQEFNTNVKKQIVILSSTTNYEKAKDLAREAAVKMKREWRDEFGLKPNKETGLTMSKKDCAESGWDYPCYGARGHGSAENSYYISVEHSNSYEGLADGYFIVVACIDEPNSLMLKASLQTAKKYYKDAYVRNIKVWFGCMH